MTNCAVWPVSGHAFEDILDGYFPLSESVRQMMERHEFTNMWISLLHAPVMNIRDLPPTAPVPLYLPKIYAGMIEHMVIAAETAGDTVRMSGVGEWFWVDGTRPASSFPASTRLGEPAFVRGIGIRNSTAVALKAPSAHNLALVRVDGSAPAEEGLSEATLRLGWSAGRAWGIRMNRSEILRLSSFDDAPPLLGKEIHASEEERVRSLGAEPVSGADWSHVLVNISPEQTNLKALELVKLI
ncbi:MAG: hypothetical protein ACRECW_13165 [Phyllobacterium sp.]